MDARTMELIHGDIDDALDAGERAELAGILEASSEARQEHERLCALHRMIEQLPEFDPPPGLRDSILAAARPVAGTTSVLPTRRRHVGISLAAALAATVVGIAFLVGQNHELTELDASVLAGTLGRPAADGPVHSMRLDGSVVSGLIMLHHSTEGPALEVDLDASRSVEIIATAGSVQLELRGFVRVDGMPSGMKSENGAIRVSHAGRQHYVLVLASDAAAPAIDLAVFDGQQLIQQAILGAPADPLGRSDR